MQLGDDGAGSLGCDSLALLNLASAANEMFHLYAANLDAEMLRARTFGEWLNIIESAWRAGVAHLTFRTSGSTGTPKRCTHAFEALQTEVHFLAGMLAAKKRVLALVPAHHIYGFLFTGMLPDRLGAEVVTSGIADGTALRVLQNDLLISIPERWAFLSRTVTVWPAQVDGVVSTSPCPRELIRDLIDNGLRSMTEIYGSTETAGIGTRRWPEERYQLMPHWVPGEDADPERTTLVHLSGTRVQPMDRLRFDSDGCFTIAGRLDGAVQVGGINVFPSRIAALLAARPGIANAAVDLFQPNGRLRAFIVLKSGVTSELVRPELETWMQQHLVAVDRPQTLEFVTALPKSASQELV